MANMRTLSQNDEWHLSTTPNTAALQEYPYQFCVSSVLISNFSYSILHPQAVSFRGNLWSVVSTHSYPSAAAFRHPRISGARRRSFLILFALSLSCQRLEQASSSSAIIHFLLLRIIFLSFHPYPFISCMARINGGFFITVYRDFFNPWFFLVSS
jgi:hypothetical protein